MGWTEWLDAASLERLEREHLPAFLPRQRWFASKTRVLEAVRIVDSAPLIRMSAPTEDSILALAEARFRDGGTETYCLPLLRAAGIDDGRFGPEAVVARLGGPGGPSIVVDALADDEVCAALLAMIETGCAIKTRLGEIRALPTAVYAEARGPSDRPPVVARGRMELPFPDAAPHIAEILALGIARGRIEQSNSAIRYDGRLIMKLFRRLEPGINPDFEIGRFLSERTGFDRIPQTAGAIEYARAGGSPTTLAILQNLVPNQGTGWEHALEELKEYYSRVGGRADDPSTASAFAREAARSAVDDASTLGRRTAELHLALASDANDPEFAPAPLGAADLGVLAREIREQVDQTLEVLRAKLDDLPPPIDGQARRVLDGASRLLGTLADLPGLATGASKIRIHGDYHLGQVLWAGGDYVILDFEGEPARALARRRAKQSPLKDVVGMLRSFDYAAYAGLFAFCHEGEGDFERLAGWARAWREGASAAFLDAYLTTARGASFLPARAADRDLLLRAFTLDKALYELLYELNNRPAWVRIPLQGVLALVEQSEAAPEKGPAGDR